MKTTALTACTCLAFGVGASVAAAHPIDRNQHHSKLHPVTAAIHTESPQADDFFDDFDSYKAGSDIIGQGGWETWYTPGEHAEVSDDFANSAPNSLKDHAKSDIVHQFSIDSGQWDLSVQTYMPSDVGGTGAKDAYVIMLNQYGSDSTNSWSVQVRFSAVDGIVENQYWQDPNGLYASLPLITDQWVELSAHIDLDADTLDISYGGQALITGVSWTTGNNFGNPVPGIDAIAALDLFTDTADAFYYDDVSLKAAQAGCYPDCNGDKALDLFDFLCFTNDFNTAGAYSNCDGNGSHDLFDFLCFLNAFNAGC